MLNTVSHHLKKKSIVTLENSSTKSREPSLFENKKTYYSKLVMAVNILHFGIAMEIFSNLCMSDITVMWIYVAIIQDGIIHDILLNIIRTGKVPVAKRK